MQKEEIRYLIEQYIEGHLTEVQAEALWALTEPGNDSDILAMVKELMQEESFKATLIDALTLKEQLQKVLAVDKASAPLERTLGRAGIWRRLWWPAAAIVLLLAGGGYFWHAQRPSPVIVATQTQQQRFKNDIAAPVGTKTTLTLASGRQIVLDSIAVGTLGQQGNAGVVKTASGQLAYNALNEKPTELVYNLLTTQRGGQTVVVLADGTKVWLDAASSLRFPTTFPGKDRRVVVTGQAYFEVARNDAKPFYVRAKGIDISVLGTHFNVKAYDDEPTRTITLLEGAVRVSDSSQTTELAHGQQAQIDARGVLQKLYNADLESTVAWKNGYFLFRSTDLATVLQEAARWYDVDIIYKNTNGLRFNGEVPRNTPLSDLLKVMELSGKIKFGIDGRKVIVLK